MYNYLENKQEEIVKEKVDSSLGITEFDEEFKVDETFTSHLPLVIIDTEGAEIPGVYTYNKAEERFVLKDENLDPYVNGKITIIDNENNINTLSDDADLVSNMKIKYRGNSSVVFEKHQFKVKLLTEDGQKNKQSIMGMAPDSDWIINISMIDSTLVRNYMTYTLAGKLMEFAPKVKYCEVIMKDGDSYHYQGLYMMMENIKQGKGRVDIKDYDPTKNYTSYILRRDRYDEEDIMIEDTYALDNNLGYGYLGIKYPEADDVDEKVYNYIRNDIDTIERILYSEDRETFLQYDNYINEDSFIDYFLFNEFFANYDAGNNSTYLYKDVGGKLTIGPVWDYDNAMDNIGQYMLDTKRIDFAGQTWFSELVKSEKFCRKLKKRYAELSQGMLSSEYISNFIDETMDYLGNARKRDWARWNHQYTKERFDLLKDGNGVVVDRNYKTHEENVQRLKDLLTEHSKYIMPGLEKLEKDSIFKMHRDSYAGFAIAFIVIFFSTVVIVRRRG